VTLINDKTRLAHGIAMLALFATAFLPVPPNITAEKGTTVVRDQGGSTRSILDWTMAPSTVDGHAAVRFTEEGRGRWAPFENDVRWFFEAIWTADGAFRPLRFERTVKDPNGRILATEKKTFDAHRNSVTFERQRTNGAVETKRISVPADTLTPEGIAGVLRGLSFNSRAPYSTHFLSNEPRLYDVSFENRGRELLHTAAGDFDCYKVEMVFHLGLLGVVKAFLPKTYLWFTVTPPHFWVRYEGYESGYGTPQVVMELTSYQH